MATRNGKHPPVRNRLRELREAGKREGGMWLTTAEVARLRGISEGWVSLQETGKRRLTDEDVEAYARIYKVRPHMIFKNLTVKSSTQ